jgi:hypothetical protein
MLLRDRVHDDVSQGGAAAVLERAGDHLTRTTRATYSR